MGGSDYDVFVSYARSVSTPLAVALQRELERFAKRWNQVRALRVFRDDSSMSASPSLWSSIEAALTTSKYFILIATPESAASEYVDQEARWWVTHKGADSILVVLAGGKLDWSDAAGGFTPDSVVPPALQRAFAEEPRWIDMTWFDDPGSAGDADLRFQERVADLAAPVRGVDRDALIGANLAEHRKTMRRARIAIAALSTLLVAALVAGGVAVVQRNTAKRLFADSVGQRIAPEAAQMLSGEIPGGTWRGLQQMMVAQRLQADADPGAYLNAMVATANIEKAATTAPGRPAVSAKLNLIATDNSAGEIHIWDTELKPVGLPIQTGNNSYPRAFSHDGNLLATGSASGLVELWDLRTRIRKASMQIASTRGPEQAFIEFVLFTPDDKGLVIRTGDNTVGFYGTDTLRQTAPAIPNTAWLTAPADGNIIAVAPLRGSAVEIRNPWTGDIIGEPLVTDPEGMKLSFDDCRSFDAAGNRLQVGREIFDLTTRKVAGKITLYAECPNSNAALSPDGTMLLTGGDRISLATEKGPERPQVDEDPYLFGPRVDILSGGGPFAGVRWLDRRHAITFSPGDLIKIVANPAEPYADRTSKVVFGGVEGDMAIQGLPDVIVYRGGDADNAIPGRLFHAREDLLYTIDPEAETLEEWSFQSGSRTRSLNMKQADVNTMVTMVGSDTSMSHIVVRDGPAVIVNGERLPKQRGGTLRRWDLTTGQQIGGSLAVPADVRIEDFFVFDGGQVTAFTRDGTTQGDFGSMWLFDLDNGTSTRLHRFAQQVGAVKVCRDSGGRVVTMIALDTGAVGFVNGRLAETLTWSHPPTLAHPGWGYGDLWISDDCRTGASWEDVSGDGHLQFWDVDSGTPLGKPIPKGSIIGSGEDGRVGLEAEGFPGFRIMPTRPSAVDLCAKLVSNMSRKQWNEWISPDIEYQKACSELPIAPDE
jgi:WD40 repeat protein